jgi:hypothetical protein
MEILIGLTVATLLVIGWIYGNLFVCVFLTLPLLLLFCLAAALNGPAAPYYLVGCPVLLFAIWAPFVIRRRT